MLNMNATPQVWIDHEETGTSFEIVPISPRDNEILLKKCKDKHGNIDHIKHNGVIVEFSVRAWKGVGANGVLTEPTDTVGEGKNEVKGTKRQLGEMFPRIANHIFAKATDAALFLEEEDDAKND